MGTNIIENIEDVKEEISKTINVSALTGLFDLVRADSSSKSKLKGDSEKLESRKVNLFSGEDNSTSLESEKKALMKYCEKGIDKLNTKIREQKSLIANHKKSQDGKTFTSEEFEENRSEERANEKQLNALIKNRDKFYEELSIIGKIYSSKKINQHEFDKYNEKAKENFEAQENANIMRVIKPFVSIILNQLNKGIKTKVIVMEINNAKDELETNEFKKMKSVLLDACKEKNIEIPSEINTILIDKIKVAKPKI